MHCRAGRYAARRRQGQAGRGCSQGGDVAVAVTGDAHPAAAHGAARAP
jgi:hypothetical protein